MSFRNTKTPVKPVGDAKWQVPMVRKAVYRTRKDGSVSEVGSVMEYQLDGELKERFVKLFPVHSNVRLMRWFGISFSTLQRFKNELGLAKDMRAIRRELAADVKRTCERNGYYESMRGKRLDDAVYDGARRYIAEHGVPIEHIKRKNPRRYKRLMAKRSARRKALIENERRRYRLTLQPLTDLPVHIYAGECMSKREVAVRHYARKHGYVPGSIDPDMGERHVIWYTDDTVRRLMFEARAVRDGFEFRRR